MSTTLAPPGQTVPAVMSVLLLSSTTFAAVADMLMLPVTSAVGSGTPLPAPAASQIRK